MKVIMNKYTVGLLCITLSLPSITQGAEQRGTIQDAEQRARQRAQGSMEQFAFLYHRAISLTETANKAQISLSEHNKILKDIQYYSKQGDIDENRLEILLKILSEFERKIKELCQQHMEEAERDAKRRAAT